MSEDQASTGKRITRARKQPPNLSDYEVAKVAAKISKQLAKTPPKKTGENEKDYEKNIREIKKFMCEKFEELNSKYEQSMKV